MRRSFDEAVFAVAVALTRGATLVGTVYTVGRVHEAIVQGVHRYACLDLRGSPVSVPEIERHATSLYTFDETERHDFTAAGAAFAFVRVEGHARAAKALKRAGVKPATPFKSVRSKTRESYVIEAGRA